MRHPITKRCALFALGAALAACASDSAPAPESMPITGGNAQSAPAAGSGGQRAAAAPNAPMSTNMVKMVSGAAGKPAQSPTNISTGGTQSLAGGPARAAAGSGGSAPGQPGAESAAPQTGLGRPQDPILLTGDALAPVKGQAPEKLVAFRYVGGQWQQIPLQVDERAEVDYYNVYNKQYSSPGAFKSLSYVDPATLTGPDSDPTIDADDEVVFMAQDLGDKPESSSEPPGVVAGTAVEVHASDPMDAQKHGYAYLFTQDGSLKADAGKPYVSYAFKLKAGEYPGAYKFTSGPNPEETVFKSSSYERHFTDRWLSDVLKVTAGGAPGADILDVEETRLLDGCSRYIGTFNMGEGAFVTNKSGPVRAIRSYIGANSGPFTQKTHWLYEAREDQLSQLRVHPLPWGPMSSMDFSSEGVGLTYYDNNNKSGALIDGTPDKLTAATNDSKLLWQLMTGPQATVAVLFEYDTDIEGLMWSSIFIDDKNTSETQCSGDTKTAYGECGPTGSGALPSTDPSTGGTSHMSLMRHHYYLAPNAQVSDAERLYTALNNPIKVEVLKR